MNCFKPLLDECTCDSMYSTLNDTNVFKYDEELKAKHTQVCAVLDRLRHAISWINSNQETPKGYNAPTGLMTFMMFASLIKDAVECLREGFGLSATIFDKGHPDSRQFFKDVCMNAPLNIAESECPTDDAFFMYFRSLVFAHSSAVTKSQGILFPGEVQYCPYVIEHELKEYSYEPDDYVGVMIYSSYEDRNWKALRVRFSTLKAYLKSRYDSLRLVLDLINKKITKNTRAWKRVKVDDQLSPLEQLKFMRNEFEKRCDEWLSFEAQQLIDLLESPCSIEENQERVGMYRQEIARYVPQLAEAFTALKYSDFFCIVEHLTRTSIDESRKLNYTLRKVFEYLGDTDKRAWATRDIDMLMREFAGKWVSIGQKIMTAREIEMLLTVACYYEYGQYQPMERAWA